MRRGFQGELVTHPPLYLQTVKRNLKETWPMFGEIIEALRHSNLHTRVVA